MRGVPKSIYIPSNNIVVEVSEMSAKYTVYHGGSLLGLGRWSGPHRSHGAAERSAAKCERVVGGTPTIRAER